MLTRWIRVARQLSLIGLAFWACSASAEEPGHVLPDVGKAAEPPRLNPVHFADGRGVSSEEGASLLSSGPTPTPAPRQPASSSGTIGLVTPPAPVGPTSPPKPVSPTSPAPVAGPGSLPAPVSPANPAVAPPAVAPAAKPSGSAASPLVPVPESKYLGPAEIEVTSFHSITPGISTRAEVEKSWGKPKETRQSDAGTAQWYVVEPFPRVEVAYSGEKVSSLVIRFDHGFPASQVAEQLELAKVQPVLVSNELGEVLGQAYPERGVMFAFEAAADPAKALKKVTHIILEPISAEPFVLRAETNIENRPEFGLQDAKQAVKLQPTNARAHWLRSRALTALGQHEEAVNAATEAVRLDPRDARYQVAKARALQQAGRIPEAAKEAEQAIAVSASRPHVKARAICLLGDLRAAGGKADFKQALQLHTEALQVAEPLATNRHPAIRIAAKEVLLDAHLGALQDIAWGPWREKERAAENWIGKAVEIAQDLVKAEGGSDEYMFRVSVKALSANVGMQGKLDPGRWSKEVVRCGEVLISAAPEPPRKAELQWQVAMALYDAMQVYQMRSDSDEALRHGQLAISYLEKSGRPAKSPSAAYLEGRTYFRIGAVYANNRKDHRTAVTWFEKAVPLLGRSPPAEAMIDLGRLGDSFVSMGVSYWSAGNRKKAVALTEHGADLIEEAVRRGTHDRNLLATPYANLAVMNREMGDAAAAARMQELAEKAKGTTIR